MIKHILAILVWIVTLSDAYLASRALFLELNPLASIPYIGFGGLVVIKVLFACLITYWIYKREHKNEVHLFHFAALLMLIFFLWGYGAFSGIYGYAVYEKAEDSYVEIVSQQIEQDTGIPATVEQEEEARQEARAAVKAQVDEIMIPAYTKVVWLFGIIPYAFAYGTFFIWRRLLPTARIKKRVMGGILNEIKNKKEE